MPHPVLLQCPVCDAPTLTPRQMDIIVGIVAGKTDQQIGLDLGIAKSTVKNMVLVIFDKLGARNRTQAAVYAIHRGYVTLEEETP